MRDRWLVLWLLVAAVGYLLLAGWLPPTDDELYYWCWSRDLQLSYYDHPPLTAYLIRASTTLFGDGIRAVRLPACLSALVSLAVVGHLTRSRWLLPLLLATPSLGFGAVLITPDAPLLALWASYLAWLVRIHEKLDSRRGPTSRDWLLGGVLLGAGAMAKYTMALAVPAGFVTFLLAGRKPREWLPGYLLHGLCSAGVFLPVLAFNVERDFAPIRFQLAHVQAADSPGGLEPFGQFVGMQVLLFGLLPFLLLPWVIGRLRTLAITPMMRVAGCLYALPLAFFITKSLTGPLEGNWALVSYLGLWPLAARWASSPTRAWVGASTFAVPILATTLLGVHLASPIGWVPPRHDRVTRQGAKIELAEQAAETIRRCGEHLPVYVPTYQWTALLRYHGVDARQLDGISRPSHFTTRPEFLTDGDTAYMFSEGALPLAMTPGFDRPEVVATLPLVVRGEPVSVFYLLRYPRTRLPEESCPGPRAAPTRQLP